jgi:hypothetical protein
MPLPGVPIRPCVTRPPSHAPAWRAHLPVRPPSRAPVWSAHLLDITLQNDGGAMATPTAAAAATNDNAMATPAR